MAHVRQFDFEHYLCVLLLPPHLHQPSFALRAFNVELAQVRDNVSDVHTGRMRLQFWQDTLGVLTAQREGPLPRTPVAAELAAALRSTALSADLLTSLVTARSARIAEKAFTSTAELESYGRATEGALIRLQLQAGGLGGQEGLQAAADSLGAAWALAGQLRAVGVLAARRGRCVLPLDAMARHGAAEEDVLRGRASPGLSACARSLADRAEELLQECCGALQREGADRRTLAHFLPAVSTRLYLRRLKEVEFDPLDARTRPSPGSLPLRLWWARLRRSL